jgi:SNF2 family DNA or RNA helicase
MTKTKDDDTVNWDEIREEWESQFKDEVIIPMEIKSIEEIKTEFPIEVPQSVLLENLTQAESVTEMLENEDEVTSDDLINMEIEESVQEELDTHDPWNCPVCDGNMTISDESGEELDCTCHCHVTPEEEPERELDDREKLELMIKEGKAKRVNAYFNPKSTIHKDQCPYCKQVALEESREVVDNIIYLTLQCGHVITKTVVETINESSYKAIVSGLGKRPFDFQAKGAVFLDNCNGDGLIADEMGLGKTIQAEIWLKMHKEAWPFIIVTKASLKVNWLRETIDWLDTSMIQIINKSSELPVPGFNGYIISVDTLGRCDWTEDAEYHDFIKTVIVDECQTIKNMDAKRTKRVRQLCMGKEHKIFLSGTPIKNNAREYFPVLNILRPTKFYGEMPFIQDWVDVYDDGYSRKVGGIRNDRLAAWKELTKEFIIRRTRDEVNLDLPPIMRSYQYHDLGENVRKSYAEAFEEFMESSSGQSVESWANTLAAMQRMRHLTGIAKIEPCIELVEDFLLMKPDEKLVIFAHHRDVIGTIAYKLGILLEKNGLNPPLVLTGETPSNTRQDMVDSFKNDPKNRIMIASLLAAGEGLNLQFCSNCIILERQWNPANEEQGEGRFSRLGRADDQPKSISAEYLVAIDTIDEFFAKLVERKRSFMASTLDGKEYKWDESSLMQELANELREKGRKPWMMNPKVKH